MENTGLQRIQTDCFFTKKEVAEYLVNKVDFADYDTVIEPSAGSGVFLEFLNKNHNNVVSYDISPLHPDTIKKDFLKTPTTRSGKVMVIGNPPFGRQSSLAKKFIKHSCKFASCIAFILPKSFKKPSMIKCFEEHFHITFEEDLPKNSFLINNEQYDVPCVFQIWIKKQSPREIPKKEVEAEYYKIIKKEEVDANTLAFKRVGGNAGKFYYENLEKLSKESHIFIKMLDNNSRDLESIQWNTKDFTVGARSISKQELILQMNNLKL